MMNPLDARRAPQQRNDDLTPLLALGFAMFLLGVMVTVGIRHLPSFTADPIEARVNVPETIATDVPQQESTVTRNAPVDLLALAPKVKEPDVVPAAVLPVAPVEDGKPSIADQIRTLVERSPDPEVSAEIAEGTARRETMSVAIRGVKGLVEAAVAQQYQLSVDPSGRLRIFFPNHVNDQRQLERLLSNAAAAGMVAVPEGVRGSDGAYNGAVLLFDLVERALINGTEIERDTGLNIRRQMRALSQPDDAARTVQEPTTGDRLYTVEAGDSLAYIALQFYGNTNAYLRIFEANRDTIAVPDRIEIGQKLRIPEI